MKVENVVKFECSQIEARRIESALRSAERLYRESSKDYAESGNEVRERDHADEADRCESMASQILDLFQ